jgi:hypothetical protein
VAEVIRAYAAAALLALWAASGVWAYHLGQSVCDARHTAALARAQAAQIAAADAASRKEADRLAAEQTAAELARELEDLANADQSNACGLSVGRVQRLNRYSAP